jgi:hypothetical protein
VCPSVVDADGAFARVGLAALRAVEGEGNLAGMLGGKVSGKGSEDLVTDTAHRTTKGLACHFRVGDLHRRGS